ncbi:hypothetical protein B0H10DRAFT_1949406 [Mycena sp. CBHHK59/15]|nr:hypothetical protein B0H10DRAFT_1949406 [Mycena sp. CBHHK59/15]
MTPATPAIAPVPTAGVVNPHPILAPLGAVRVEVFGRFWGAVLQTVLGNDFRHNHVRTGFRFDRPIFDKWFWTVLGTENRIKTGGVAWVVNSARVPFNLREDLSGPDFMAIQMANIVIYNVYLLPETINWVGDLERDPCLALASSLAVARAGVFKILIFSDLNARTLNWLTVTIRQ